jgi:hypothetical protein
MWVARALLVAGVLTLAAAGCGSTRKLTGRQQFDRLVSCVRRHGARAEIVTANDPRPEVRRSFTRGIVARVVVTPNVQADEWGKRPIAGAAVLAQTHDAARNAADLWRDFYEQDNVRLSGYLVLQPTLDTSAPVADKAAHECFAAA